jgi:hypothetical protein
MEGDRLKKLASECRSHVQGAYGPSFKNPRTELVTMNEACPLFLKEASR